MDYKTEQQNENRLIERTQDTREQFVDRIQVTLDILETWTMRPDKGTSNYHTWYRGDRRQRVEPVTS